MKNLIMCLVLLVLTSSNYLYSQNKNLYGSIGTGLSSPMIGYNISGNFGTSFNDFIGGRIDLQFNVVEGGPDLYATNIISIVPEIVAADFKNISKPKKLIPYAFAGVGYSHFKKGIGVAGYYRNNPEFNPRFSVGMGGGLIYKFSEGVGISGEIKYGLIIGPEKFDYIPYTVSLVIIP